MKTPLFFNIFIFLSISFHAIAQSTYTSANYAVNGDTVYLTKAQLSNFNFDTTGANIIWNYSALAGNSQTTLTFRPSSQTGFTNLQWPYINNTNNVNLTSTDEQTLAAGGIQETNPNDFFYKSASLLQQKASSFTININNGAFNVKNVYTNPDSLYHFPIAFGNTNSSHASYNITVPPNLYYQNVILNRKDSINGWGKLITPYGTFSNCLKSVSTVMEIDSIAIDGKPVSAIDTSYYRELKWFDPSKPYPVLTVTEDKVGSIYVTQTVQYFDVQQYYQPIALFAYFPLSPDMGDTLTFQNISTNAQTYKWYFSDTTSGSSDSSTEVNPQHIFNNPGTYPVKLIAYNGPLTDTFTLAIIINPVNVTYTFTGNGNWSTASNWSNNAIPPSPLPATNSITISPIAGGKCLLDVPQHILNGASIMVITGKTFEIPGPLLIQ